jgi:hypothetical protein
MAKPFLAAGFSLVSPNAKTNITSAFPQNATNVCFWRQLNRLGFYIEFIKSGGYSQTKFANMTAKKQEYRIVILATHVAGIPEIYHNSFKPGDFRAVSAKMPVTYNHLCMQQNCKKSL